MLNSLSAGHIALSATETGKQTTHITLFTWYDPFHNEVTCKCEQKKKIKSHRQQSIGLLYPIQDLF